MEFSGENALFICIIKRRLGKQYIDLYVSVLTDVIQNSFKVFLLLCSELIGRDELGEDIHGFLFDPLLAVCV